MRAGFTVWNERIAPVFDTAGQIHMVDAMSGRIMGEMHTYLPLDSPAGKAMRLAELRVDELVCGAISYPMRAMVVAYGIRVYPFVTGPLDQIVRAWLTNTLGAAMYAMPGCCGGRRRGHRAHFGARQEDMIMQGMNTGGVNTRPGKGRGRMGGQVVGGPGAYCVCPQCGHKEPHQRGIPCNQSRCPTCGLALTRE